MLHKKKAFTASLLSYSFYSQKLSSQGCEIYFQQRRPLIIQELMGFNKTQCNTLLLSFSQMNTNLREQQQKKHVITQALHITNKFCLTKTTSLGLGNSHLACTGIFRGRRNISMSSDDAVGSQLINNPDSLWKCKPLKCTRIYRVRSWFWRCQQ